MPPPVPGTKAHVGARGTRFPARVLGSRDLLLPLGRPPAKSRAQPCAPTIRIEPYRAQGLPRAQGVVKKPRAVLFRSRAKRDH